VISPHLRMRADDNG